MKKTLIGALTTALVVGAASTTFAAANPFSDVPAGHWAYDAVSQLAADGVIEGYGDTTFQGDKNITRYEMAQMVAKAMAKTNVPSNDKALIDKLAAEFGDELKNLGVRVSNLEKHSDNMQWKGEMRYRYISDRPENGSKKNNDQLLFRLEPQMEVNSNWMLKSRIDAPVDMKNDTSASVTVKRIWAEGSYPNFTLKFGKMPLFSTETYGMLFDTEFSGASATFGKQVKLTVEGGRWSGIKASNDSAASYQGVTVYGANGKFDAGAGYRHFNSSAFLTYNDYTKAADEDNANIWSVGAGYRFDKNAKLYGGYGQNTDADNYDHSYNIQLDYKGAQKQNAGTWGAYAAYRYLGKYATFAPTYEAFSWTSVKTNAKGWEIGASYVPLKNVQAFAYYFNGKQLENDEKLQKLFGRLSYFF